MQRKYKHDCSFYKVLKLCMRVSILFILQLMFSGEMMEDIIDILNRKKS